MGKRMIHPGMFTRRMNDPNIHTFAATIIIYYLVSLNGSGAKSINTDCCRTINITSNGDALEKQGIRFGEYSMTAENNGGYLIYQYQHKTDKSTLMRDSRSGEWKVYNGGSIKPKVDRQVIKSGCNATCVDSCTDPTFKYLDGDNFKLDDTIKLNCVISDGADYWWIWVLIVVIFLGIVLAILIWYFAVKKQYCKVDGKEREPEVFAVQINDIAGLYKIITLPTDELELKATCALRNPDVEDNFIQPFRYEYTWINASDPSRTLGRHQEYTPKDLEQGVHEYKVTVTCGLLEAYGTATVTVKSGDDSKKPTSNSDPPRPGVNENHSRPSSGKPPSTNRKSPDKKEVYLK